MTSDMECGGKTPLFKGATRCADQSADMSAHSKEIILCTEKDHGEIFRAQREPAVVRIEIHALSADGG